MYFILDWFVIYIMNCKSDWAQKWIVQALSNDIYISAKHRVVAAEKVERFSVAYFYNPSKDALIESHIMPPMYRKFTFGEYRRQIEKDVKETGDKVGLSRFLL